MERSVYCKIRLIDTRTKSKTVVAEVWWEEIAHRMWAERALEEIEENEATCSSEFAVGGGSWA